MRGSAHPQPRNFFEPCLSIRLEHTVAIEHLLSFEKRCEAIRPLTAGGSVVGPCLPEIRTGVARLAGAGADPFIGVGSAGQKTFAIGYAAGLAQYLVPFYWLLLILKRVEAVIAWLVIGAFMALYTAGWTWLCCHLAPISREKAPEGWAQLADQLGSITLRQRVLWAFACAAAWVAMEMGIARILTGFPYVLGVSQFKILPLIQIASLTGVYGVSFLIVWISVSLMIATLVAFRRPTPYRLWLGQLALPMVALAAVLIFGFEQLRHEQPSGRELKIALVQPAIPQFGIWDPAEKTNRFNKLVQLSQRALAEQPDLLVWPEAALPAS